MLRYYKVEYFSPAGEDMGCAKIACEHKEEDVFYVVENNLAASQLFFYAISYAFIVQFHAFSPPIVKNY